MVGNTYGYLKVLNIKTIDRKTFCHCKCLLCNESEVDVEPRKLVKGLKTTCGCYYKLKPFNRVPLVGKKYGKLTVLEDIWVSNNHKYSHKCRCKCDCGNETVVAASHLTNGHTRSCGCARLGMGYKGIEPGTRFGSLVVEELSYKQGRKYFYKCKCDCGNEVDVWHGNLISGNTQSCGHGCLRILGSRAELEIKSVIEELTKLSFVKTYKILDGKEIDLYNDDIKLGIEYCGSAFHATVGGLYTNKDINYHQQKFLTAKEKGINLITIFDKDWEDSKDTVISNITHIVNNTYKPFIPTHEVEYTDNDYGTGNWIREFGYVEVGQEQPTSFNYDNRYIVYRCGRTIWRKL